MTRDVWGGSVGWVEHMEHGEAGWWLSKVVRGVIRGGGGWGFAARAQEEFGYG